ncbi:DNA-(apurinic or apyrimidinic site) lyase 2 [Galendromus occidentalis]|uniref:DNA-(apurinic or apyrimidinic site) endonuclease n=1 Tax=Galendromus occidentalis TaxID=34638 RepID=A0AAJ6QUS4_9ACAR|nr:DNA-(apurinic or apyrimidinic site) lyase 2 [Galendromus occidentalis]
MKIVTWNINGLRTFKGVLRSTLDSFNADIICVQETKTNRSTLEEDLACVPGYNSYFAFPRLLTGYSGVATYCSDNVRPFAANESLLACESDGINEMDELTDVPDPLEENAFLSQKEILNVDSEGRTLVTSFNFLDGAGQTKQLLVFNLYCPRNDPDRPERAQFKYNFNAMLEHQAVCLVKKGFHVILTGDMNISHKRIDNCDPGEDFEESPARIWLTKMLDQQNDVYFVDVFRHMHPDAKEQYTCWNSQKSARLTNFGTRIDYIICDSKLLEYFESCDIHPDVMGSDHCPVSAVLKLNLISNEKLIRKCTRNWPEFSGKQTSLSSFLVKKTSSAESAREPTAKKRSSGAAGGQATLSSFFAKKPKIAASDEPESTPVPERIEKSAKCKELNSNWKNILRGPPPAPLCSGHGELSVLRIVKKDGINKGKRFYCCARPEGRSDNKEARCSFFVWI